VGRVEPDRDELVFEQVMKRSHPARLALDSAAAGHRLTDPEVDRALEGVESSKRSQVRRRIMQGADEAFELFETGAHARARQAAKDTCLSLISDLGVDRAKAVDYSSMSPSELASLIGRR
jgi:hypothetical protein